jgi:hypothetical protein
MFMCRWPNGDLSFVSSQNKEEAIVMLDEWGGAEVAELRQVQDVMLDFSLTDEGELVFQEFGEGCLEDIWDRAYPVLSEAKRNAPTNRAGEITARGKDAIRNAVEAEKQRLVGKKTGKAADTELGKSVQARLGAPAVLVNRYVKQAAAEVLKKTPTSGRKQ